MVDAAIVCVVKVLKDQVPFKAFTSDDVAKKLGDEFGFVIGRDFTIEDIEKELLRENQD